MSSQGKILPPGFRPIEQNEPIPGTREAACVEAGPFELLIKGKVVRAYYGGVPTKWGGQAWGWITPTGLLGYYTPEGWRWP